MSRLAAPILILLTCLVVGCDEGQPPPAGPGPWQVFPLWPRGTMPVGSPDGQSVLFIQEQAPAGLYLLQGSQAVHLNPDGPAARSDYSFSRDGSRIAVSSPGTPGSGAGIYTAYLTSPMVFQSLWDRGSDPCFLPGTEGLLCAGPEDGTGDEGIWQISLDGTQRFRLAASGVQPELSPNGVRIAYLVPGGTEGRTLAVLDRESAHVDTLAGSVLRFGWLGDSQTLVVERMQAGVQEIATVRVVGGLPPSTVSVGTWPAGFPTGTNFVFTGLDADRLDGLFIGGLGANPARLTSTGTMAFPVSDYLIFAADSTGLIMISRSPAGI
jgi:hypothetical protein